MDNTANTHVLGSSLTIAHNKNEEKTTTGQYMDCSTKIKHQDDIGWYMCVLFLMMQNTWNIIKNR